MDTPIQGLVNDGEASSDKSAPAQQVETIEECENAAQEERTSGVSSSDARTTTSEPEEASEDVQPTPGQLDSEPADPAIENARPVDPIAASLIATGSLGLLNRYGSSSEDEEDASQKRDHSKEGNETRSYMDRIISTQNYRVADSEE